MTRGETQPASEAEAIGRLLLAHSFLHLAAGICFAIMRACGMQKSRRPQLRHEAIEHLTDDLAVLPNLM